MPAARSQEEGSTGWLANVFSSRGLYPQGEQGGVGFISLPGNSAELPGLQGVCLCVHVCVCSVDSCYVLS